ncbi:hypothetical protein GCM10010193_08850 [Kitasatospora atroaurantiaca]|uniref:Uncharacterized protein n=1 Tax=Kitasatospora atroaurantiaca TaxID=285545 RepID=A0A561ERW0_9ACTN|nr:hypothetical protein [Kitasatospora atroaurantiaca]TWE18341.1 hypothetical protein FB465_3408 [Kitasatospora atroaurantiaca]
MTDDQAEYHEMAERARKGLPDPPQALMAYAVSVAGLFAFVAALLASALMH